jgi:hypothetical protein
MQQLRAKITRLRGKIEEKLPDQTDLFGYPGISRAGILTYVDQIYGLTHKIEELRGGFDLVVLRRKVDPRFEICKVYLSDTVGTKHAGEEFDKFLNSLTVIHDEVFLSHVIYFSEGVRTEAEVGAAVAALDEAKSSYERIAPLVAEALEQLEGLGEKSEQVDAWYENIEASQSDVESYKATAKKASDDASASYTIASKFETEIKAKGQAVDSLLGTAKGAEGKLTKLLAKAAADLKAVDATLEGIAELERKNKLQSETIETTLRHASKHGMASSFRERKEELLTPLVAWAVLFAVSMVALVTLGAFFILPKIEQAANPADIGQLGVRITLLAPLIWLGWMSAKQYGYVSRIREDYSFKYASALAFEGYKKEATEGHPEVLEDLLKVATENMALNPLRIYSDDPQPASPLHELIASALKSSDTKSTLAEVKDAALGVLRKKVGGSGDP